MPALLTRMSIRPPSTVVVISASSPDRAALPSRSAGTKWARPPAASISLTTAAPRSRSRPETATSAPSAANATAIARPMLLVAPVTRAVLPARREPIEWTMRSTMPEIEWTVKSTLGGRRGGIPGGLGAGGAGCRAARGAYGGGGGAGAYVQGNRHPAAHRGRGRRAGPRPGAGQREPGRHPRGHVDQQEPALPILPGRHSRPPA